MPYTASLWPLGMQEVWLDGIQGLGDVRHRMSEAEVREVRLRTSLEEVAYALAGRKLMNSLE